MSATICRCLAHRGLRLALGIVLAVLNFLHPVLHALGLEGGSLDAALPYLNGYATILASEG